MSERAVTLECEGNELVGIIHQPARTGTLGVVVIVAGGPQYRVGAHRQFVLLARDLASRGLPVIRFDYRGTGDSAGEYRGFVDMAADINAATNCLCAEFPGLERVALWGECESASAAAYYAHTDHRVSGLFMVNPWVRTEVGLAKTYLRHHYIRRLFDPELWGKIRSGSFSFRESLSSFFTMAWQVLREKLQSLFKPARQSSESLAALPLTQRLEQSLSFFPKDIYVLTSGHDHIAQEYKDFIAGSELWRSRREKGNVTEFEIKDADHTFSRHEWRASMFSQTCDWLESLEQRDNKR